MTEIRHDLVGRIWGGNDPFDGAPVLPWDGVGYSTSQHPFLTEAIDAVRPRIVIEVGVWKGVSTMVMALRAKELALNCAVIAIDTWLGSAENWANPKLGFIPRKNGYPTIYFTFLSNCLHKQVEDF